MRNIREIHTSTFIFLILKKIIKKNHLTNHAIKQ
jgi:hypothetical protein